MGLILPQMVVVRLCGGTISRYENLGYKIPRRIDKKGRLCVEKDSTINAHVLDLPKNSNLNVKVQCDICGSIIEMQYAVYNRYAYNGEYACHNCIGESNKSKDKNDMYYNKMSKILIEELTNYINKYGYPSTIKKTFHSKNNMHSVRSYLNCFGGNLADWIEICGFKLTKDEKATILNRGKASKFSKEDTINIVTKMSKELNRPLMYDDFRNSCETNHYLSITVIKRLWGSLNKMKKELGLEVIQESMIDKQLSEEETIEQIKSICNYVREDGRNFTTTREIDKLSATVASDTLRRMIKKYFKMSLPEYFKLYNVDMGKAGNGIVFNFNDGEHTTSQFEYMFSKFLKDYGLVYNKDYFRDVKYSEFISDYKGNMNIDYIIKYKGKTIYIEIAGIIENYKLWYYEDKPITISKSKEKYRLKLKEKEQMLKENNLVYFILFPCDLTRDIFMQIFNDGSLELKHSIEKFMKNNIDWVKIQDIGELKYKDNETSCYGQLVVDYDFNEVS